jgi:serine/threonine protein phosphatase PrpC
MTTKKRQPPTALAEPRLFTEQTMDEAQAYRIGGGTIALYTSKSPDKDTPNEDTAALIPLGNETCVLVVADGAGGMASGGQASRIAAQELVDEIAGSAQNETAVREIILNGIENASETINNLGIGAGTTIAAVEIQNGSARPYHVGDSMILSVGQRGKLKLQTVSHSPVGYAVEAGFLDAEEAMHHEERHLVSNMVGTPDMRIEIGASADLAAKDTLLLATDGLFDNLHLDEIIEYVRKGPLTKAANRLAWACRKRMQTPQLGHPSKPDDLTFILYRRSTG